MNDWYPRMVAVVEKALRATTGVPTDKDRAAQFVTFLAREGWMIEKTIR